MNKLFLGIAMLLSAQATFADNGNFTVKGELKNFGDTIIAFVPVNKDYVRDTILVKNIKTGKFYASTGGYSHTIIQEIATNDFGINILSRIVKPEDKALKSSKEKMGTLSI